MRRTILKYGIISGLIASALIVLAGTLTGFQHGNFAASMIMGYAGMIIALSMIYFAIRSYRDASPAQRITFGKGVLIGVGVSVIAGIFYAITWKIYYSIAMPDFWDRYAQSSLDALRKSGASEAKILEESKQMAQYKEMFKNPLIEFGMTFIEIFPVGVLVSLICAAVLRRKPTPVTDDVISVPA